MKSKCIDKIQQGLFDLVQDTKHSKEALIKRAAVLNITEALIKNLKLTTQRRLTGKLQADQAGQIDKIFQKFSTALEGIR